MLLQNVEPKVGRPACDYSSEQVAIIGKCAQDISPVMPYLNATQHKALYQQKGNILRFHFEGCPVTLRPYEIAIGGLEDSNAGIEAMTRMQQLINDTWERRGEITPSTLERKRLHPMAVYKFLPGTNCRECGEQTCFIFANKMAAGKTDIELCTTLCNDKAFAEQKTQLLDLIGAAI